jgi:SAM-dependent methyltransferase
MISALPATHNQADAASTMAALENAAWALAALAQLCRTGAIDTDSVRVTSDDEVAAAQVLTSVGLLTDIGDGFALSPAMAELLAQVPATTRAEATTSILRQIATIAGILPNHGALGWATHDDETLIAQGRASALGGQMLATVAVAGIPGLSERFRCGGRFLDVGTGVGELGAAFADALPDATVVGLDVLERAIDLAREMIRDRNLEDRFEVRHQAVQDLDDIDAYDLAWLPAPFIPRTALVRGLANIHAALTRGGWVIVAAGRFDGDDLAVSVTRWQTQRAGGTALAAADAHTVLATAGFVNIASMPTPVGAPALYCGQRL